MNVRSPTLFLWFLADGANDLLRPLSETCDRALNRDVIVPRPAGRFLFGRLIGREGNKLQLLPPGAGARQQVVTDPPWVAMAVKLVRSL